MTREEYERIANADYDTAVSMYEKWLLSKAPLDCKSDFFDIKAILAKQDDNAVFIQPIESREYYILRFMQQLRLFGDYADKMTLAFGKSINERRKRFFLECLEEAKKRIKAE